MKRLLLLPVMLLPLFASSPAISEDGNPVTPAPRVSLAFDRFYDYAEMVEAIEKLSAAHPGWLEMKSLGKSVQGRDLWLVALNDPDGPPHTEKPAMYIDANIHGNEIQGTEVILYTMWYLLENRERLPLIRGLLDRVAFYFIPTVNPDGRDAWFHEPSTPHSPRTGLRPVDDDRDGQADEDGPDDLDGDGSITDMRKKVATGGTHRLDPDDPRRLIPVRPGEKGEYLLLGPEGIDNDGDGRINEDGPGGYDMNRNFPGDWRPSWIQWGAGPYPLCYPETRAIADFAFAHPNIAAGQSYHNTGGMIIRGPGHADEDNYPRSDLAVFDRLGRDGERILPGYDYKVLYADLYPVRGGFVTFLYERLGIICFTNELFRWTQYDGIVPDEAGGDHGEDARRRRRGARMKFSDDVEFGRHFRKWTPYHHPQYGDIEIGGLTRASRRVPPVFMLEELCHRNMAFTLLHAREMPELVIDEPEVTDLGEGLLRVRAEVRNLRLIPSITGMGKRVKAGLPDFFELEVEGGVTCGGSLLEGARLTPRLRPQEHRPGRLRVEDGVGSHGSVRAEWIVSRDGRQGVALKLVYRSQKGGTITRKYTGE